MNDPQREIEIFIELNIDEIFEGYIIVPENITDEKVFEGKEEMKKKIFEFIKNEFELIPKI